MTFGVTLQGFNAKRTADVLDEIKTDLAGVFGSGVDLDEDQPIGQIVSVFSDRLGQIWEILEDIYNSQDPDAAEGASMDAVGGLLGIPRETPTYSRVTATLFGTPGTVVPKDSVVSVAGNTSAKFNLNNDATIDAGMNEIQTITFPTIPESGTITFTFNGFTTTPIAYNASNATIKAALEALTSIGVGNINVTGDIQSGSIVVEFIATLGASPQPAITVGTTVLESAEQTTVATIADVAQSLHRTTFKIWDKNGSVGVWIDINNQGGTVPPEALACTRQFEITGVAAGASANSVAAAIASELSVDSEFSASAVGNVVTIIDAFLGARTDASDLTTGFTVGVLKQGYTAGGMPTNIVETIAGALPQVDAEFTAQVTGPVKAPSGTLTVIETPFTGWDSVSNALDEITGTDVESDIAYKTRRLTEIAVAGRSTTEAIKSRVGQVLNVKNVVVFENDTDIVDVDGRPPHTLDIVVQDGDEAAIAEEIFLTKAGGIGTIGDISQVVIDSQGFNKTIKFSRPVELLIYLELDVVININTFPVDGDDQIKAAIVTWGDALTIGQDVIVHGSSSLESSIAAIKGITDLTIRVGTTINPATDANVVVAAREVAVFDTSRITVAHV